MLEKSKALAKKRMVIFVTIIMVVCSSIAVYARTVSGTMGSASYTWTGTYQDGDLYGKTETNAAMASAYASSNYVEVTLYDKTSGSFSQVGHTKKYGAKSCSTSRYVGTGKTVQVMHHIYFRSTARSWSPLGNSIY